MPLITAVVDRLNLELPELKRLLGIDEDDDSRNDFLCLVLTAAKEAADAYMNNPFLERVDLSFDQLVNWSGNLRSNGVTVDILVNNEDDVGLNNRLKHTLPERYVQPEVQEPIPTLVKYGVVEYVKFAEAAVPFNVQRERVGDWEKQWASFVSEQDRVKFIADTYWSRYRLEPGQ